MASKRNDKRNRIVFDHNYKLVLEFFSLVRNRPNADLLCLLRRLDLHSIQRDSEDVLLESWVIINNAAQEGKLKRSWVMTIID